MRRRLQDLLRLTVAGNDCDVIFLRLESLIDIIFQGARLLPAANQLLPILQSALELLSRPLDGACPQPCIINQGSRGRPRLQVDEENLRFFLEYGFKTREIAEFFSVSQRTVQRRMEALGLREDVPRYTALSDDELDEVVRAICHEFPNCGVRRMQWFLLHRGIRVQWERVRESLRRNDPEGVLLRSLQRTFINRRAYSVAGPLSLWHMDGNHKLIR